MTKRVNQDASRERIQAARMAQAEAVMQQQCAVMEQFVGQYNRAAAELKGQVARYQAQLKVNQQMAGSLAAQGVTLPAPEPPNPELYAIVQQLATQAGEAQRLCRQAELEYQKESSQGR